MQSAFHPNFIRVGGKFHAVPGKNLIIRLLRTLQQSAAANKFGAVFAKLQGNRQEKP